MFAKPRWILMLAAAVVAGMSLSARAQQVPMPESAITEETSVAVWIDGSRLTPEALRASAETLQAAFPGDPAQKQQAKQNFEEKLAEFTSNYDGLSEAGAEGILLLVTVPADGSQPGEPARLVRVKPGTTAESIQGAFEAIDRNTGTEQYGERWIELKDANPEEGAGAPANGTAAQAEQVQAIFANTEPGAVRVAFRMTPGVKKLLEKGQERMERMRQQGGMGMMGPGAQFFGPGQGLDSLSMSVNVGEAPRLTAGLQFTDEAAAAKFNQAWNGMLGQMRGMLQFLSMRIQQQNPGGPQIEAQTIQSLFGSLEFQQDGAKLSNTLDKQFVQDLGKVIPAVQKARGGGMGGPRRGGPMGPPPRDGGAPPAPQQ